jgi:hypothetical protein
MSKAGKIGSNSKTVTVTVTKEQLEKEIKILFPTNAKLEWTSDYSCIVTYIELQ